MNRPRVVPLTEDRLPATVELCADGLRRLAAGMDPVLDVAPGTAAKVLAETIVRGFLDAEPDRRAWVVTDGAAVLAFAGATVTALTPDDARYTFMPPRSVTVSRSALHVVPGSVSVCCPLLLDEAQRVADRIGGAHLFVNAVAGDSVSADVWRRLGLRPEIVTARRRVDTWRSPANASAHVTVRRARDADLEVLTDLALEEHAYHAAHADTGVSPDQPRATSRRLAAESLAAPADRGLQLVAEDDTGRIVGCMTGSIRQVADDQVQRYLLPARHGYIGLTSVTADARGRGVGRSLLDGLMRWLADRDVATVLLQYATGNPLSSRFWARTGFTPCLHVLSRRPRLPGSS